MLIKWLQLELNPLKPSLTKWLSVRLRIKWLWVESSCSHLNFRFRACFEQGVSWHSGNYKVWIHSETRTWHDKNIQSIRLVLLFKPIWHTDGNQTFPKILFAQLVFQSLFGIYTRSSTGIRNDFYYSKVNGCRCAW